MLKRGYSPVYTPHIGRLELYRTSGHFPYYRDAQFPPMYHRPAAGLSTSANIAWPMGRSMSKRETRHASSICSKLTCRRRHTQGQSRRKSWSCPPVRRHVAGLLQVELPDYHRATTPRTRRALLKWLMEQEGFLLKPMNCPHHIQIYKAEPHSYRDLPVRLAEFGTVYRYEQTGELNGMTRVRGFTQDDAHLFITPGAGRTTSCAQHRTGAVRAARRSASTITASASASAIRPATSTSAAEEDWNNGRDSADRTSSQSSA